MEYRTVGNTGMSVSTLSFGASSLGSMFREIDEAEGIRAVFAVIDAGINYIDVAPYYGKTRAETVLGQALRQLPRDSYYLATKTGRFGLDEFDFSRERIVASCEESLQRLGVEYLDVLQLHDIEYQGGRHLERALTEGMQTLEMLKAQGKARFVGVTAYPVDVLKLAMERVKLDTILCHNHYTLCDTKITELLPVTRDFGVGLISASPLGTGLLTSRGARDSHPITEEQRASVVRAAEYCRSKNTQIEKLAIQFSHSHEEIPTTLVSTASPERLKRNVEWLSEPPDMDLIHTVQEILGPVRDVDWDFGDWSGKEALTPRGISDVD
jgi:L-galactose dehydrogenase